MCGIAGCVNFDRTPIAQDLLTRVGTQLAHRGPDGQGIYNKEGVALIHRRLSIIDLSSAGDQPMTNEDQTIWITYNGEIYNFHELKIELLDRGHRFTSNTDTEVIIHGYEEWGPRVCERLRGMFAFAIWDEPRRRLFLARDRLGQKPLVYAIAANGVSFSSELQGLLEFPWVERTPNLTALHAYLQRVYVPAPLSAFADISKLPAGHYMLVQDGEVQVERYWQLSFEPKNSASESDLADELLERLREAVKIRLMSDVPLGAFLSGGVDSSAVVGLMAGEMTEPVQTFSIRFDHAYHDETRFARRVSTLFGTAHHEYLVKPDALAILPELIRHYGEPFGDYSSIPTYYVSKMTRQAVTVALSGDAGDEHFAGYGRYRTAYWLDKLTRLPLGQKARLLASLEILVNRFPISGIKKHQVLTVLKRAAVDPARAYHFSYSFFTPDAASDIWLPGQAEHIDPDFLYKKLARSLGEMATGPLDTWLKMDLESYLPDDINVKVDIASMMHSLEVRSPFMDHELAEFAAKLPEQLKRRGTKSKYILKRALAGFLPDDILYRKKHGFSVPMAEWLRGEMREFTRAILLDPATQARGLFKTNTAENLINEHLSGTRDHAMRIWLLLNIELWYRTFIDG